MKPFSFFLLFIVLLAGSVRATNTPSAPVTKNPNTNALIGNLDVSGSTITFADGQIPLAKVAGAGSGGGGVGTVTSVSGTGTVSGLTLSGTVTSSGSLTLGGALAVTPGAFASQTANTVLIAPNGSAGAPSFRALVAADIPTLNQNTTGTAANVTGTVVVAKGGTGATTLTGLLKGNGTSAFSAATAGTDYVAPGAVTSSGLTLSTAKLLGRTTAGTGAPEEITVGSNLTLTGANLSAAPPDFGAYTRARPRPVQVTNRCVALSGVLTNSSTETQGQYRIQHKTCAAGATNISLVYGQFSNSGATIIDNTTNLGTITIKAAIEYSGSIYPVTFQGQRTVTVVPGSVVQSDPLGLIIPGNTWFYTRQLITCTGGSFSRGTSTSGGAGRQEGAEIGTSLTDKVDSGTITVANAVSAFSPMAILGEPLNGDYGSVAVLLDSLGAGVGASIVSDDKGAFDKAFSGIYGVANISVSGGTIASWNTASDARFRRALLSRIRPTVVVAGCGGNDLNIAGVTAVQVEALLTTFWTQLKAQLHCKLIGWTIPPRCTSTDSFATLANQSVNSPNTDWENQRLILNTWLRAGGGGMLDQCVDFAAIVEDGGTTQSGKWKVTGTAFAYTSDGAHPNDTGAPNAQQLIGNAVNTAIATALYNY